MGQVTEKKRGWVEGWGRITLPLYNNGDWMQYGQPFRVLVVMQRLVFILTGRQMVGTGLSVANR